MGTPPPPRLLDTTGKPEQFSSPAASIRSLTQLLEDERRTPLATPFTARPHSRAGLGRPGGAAAGATHGGSALLASLRAGAGLNAHANAGGPAGMQPSPNPQQQLAQGLLAAKESEAALLRQQLQQLTADFKFNLRLLEERDAELERVDKVLAGLRAAAASREAALTEARREVGTKEAALRDKEARVASLEERQRQLVDLCERQVADARAGRDEEVARARQDAAAAQGDAAREKAEVIAGYERQVTAAAASEREARQAAAAASEEAEHVRSQLARAEARVAEQELAMQRMVSQFEGALATLQQLEAQYDGLAADAGAADRLRAARIEELEREAAGLRGARAALQQEQDELVAAAAAAEAAAADAKQQYHRAMLDSAELSEALAGARAEASAAASRAAAAEEELAAMRAAAQQAQHALERELGAHARAQGLLEAARLAQEAARRDVGEQEALAAQLREAAAVLEVERNDCAKAAEAAEARLQAAEERAALLAEQVEQEARLRDQLLQAREAELAARWERALEAAQAERSTLQQALDLANRQLQAAHRDMESLRLQVQDIHLGAGSKAPAAPTAEPSWVLPVGSGPPGPSPGYAGSSRSSGGGGERRRELPAALVQGAASIGAAGPGSYAGDARGSVQENVSPARSHDVFSEPGHSAYASPQRQQQHAQPPARQQPRQPPSLSGGAGAGLVAAAGGGSSAPGGASVYQQQLYRHMDTLASKLSSFQRAVEDARQAGQQASRQLAESSTMLPAGLQRRQAAVAGAADERLQQALAAERQQFDGERRRLDRQLAEQQAALEAREAELQRMQRAEEERRRQRQAEDEERQRRQRDQEQQEAAAQQRQRQARRWQQLADLPEPPPAAVASSPSFEAPAALGASSFQLHPGRGVAPAASSGRQRQQPAGLDLPVLQLSPSASSAVHGGQQGAQHPQRRSVSAALADVGAAPPLPTSYAPASGVGAYGSYRSSPAAGAQAALPRANGTLQQAGAGGSRTAPLRAAAGTLGGSGAAPSAGLATQAGSGGGADGEDPLARARRQVLAAKSYLRQVADLGGRLAHDGAN